MSGPARRPSASRRARRTPIPQRGGFTFAERPELDAPDARIIWHAELDPDTLEVDAEPGDPGDPDHVDSTQLAPWLTVVRGRDGCEHAVLSDGRHHIRLDIATGSLAKGGPVVLHYRLRGLSSAEAKLLPLRRFIDLCRYRRFTASLFPADSRLDRSLATLRVHDALRDGASQRDIARILFGAERIQPNWGGESDSLRSRVRRLVVEARAMARGGYRSLMQRR